MLAGALRDWALPKTEVRKNLYLTPDVAAYCRSHL